MGYHFSTETLQLAKITVKKHGERYCRLYEQLKRKKATSNEIAFVLEQYVKRWQCWYTAGLGITSLIYDEKVLGPQVLSP